MSKDQKILVRGVNWLGDAVMSSPALIRLREARPGAHITILCHEKLADLWRGHSAIDEVVPFTSKESVFQIGRRLKMGNFDTALVLPNSPRTGLEVFCARIPERIGYSRRWRNLLLTHNIPPRPHEIRMHKRSVREIKKLISRGVGEPTNIAATSHHIHQYLHLVAKGFGADPTPIAPRLDISADDVVAARERFRVDSRIRWVGINPGAEYGPAKRWPIQNFSAVAERLLLSTDCGVILFGGKADMALTAELAALLRIRMPSQQSERILDVAGRTSLRHLCALLKVCQVVVTNDTGPMHVAAAVGSKVVVPFGSTSPEMTGPGLPGDAGHKLIKSSVPCSPCFLRRCPIDFRCMAGISVDRVFTAVTEAAK